MLQIKRLRQRELILAIQDPRASKWKSWDLCPDLCIFWINRDLSDFSLPHSVSGYFRQEEKQEQWTGMEMSLVCSGAGRRAVWVAGCHYICFWVEVTLVSECFSTRGLSYL